MRTVLLCLFIIVLPIASSEAQQGRRAGRQQQGGPKIPTAGPKHAFLKQFVGDWDCEIEMMSVVENEASNKSKAKMVGHMIGEYWVVIDVRGELIDTPYHAQGMFGYDAQVARRYVGTWADSMSDHLWKYKGRVDGAKLILEADGPLGPNNKPLRTVDTWEFLAPDHVRLTGEIETPSGEMMLVMKADCHRKSGDAAADAPAGEEKNNGETPDGGAAAGAETDDGK